MNRIILTFGLIFVALGATSAQSAEEVKGQINTIKSDAEVVSSKANSIRNKDLPNLPEQILKIAESNELIIETENQLKKNEGKGDAAKNCQALFNANYYSILDQIYVKTNELITTYFLDVTVEGLIKSVNAKLDELTKQVDNWDKLSAEDKNKINKEINQISMVVDGSKTSVSILVQNALKNVETNLFPAQAKENISKPVDECLKKIQSQ